MHIKKGDEVEVISGRDRGARGRVLRVIGAKNRAIVEGVNLVKKRLKPNPQKGVQGGVVDQESAIHISNLLPIDPTSGKATRVGYKVLDSGKRKGQKVRIARRSGAELDK